MRHFLSSALWKHCSSFVILGLACYTVVLPAAELDTKPSMPERRVALVIGNSQYQSSPLINPANDAKAIAGILEKTGFSVSLVLDANQKNMQDAIRKFGDTLKSDDVGLFYYAGHGVQIKGQNYLVPVGDEVSKEADVPYKSVNIQQVLDQMESAKNRLNIVILDACRNNPFASSKRSTAAGLSEMSAPVGSIIAFATAPGSVASDGASANGLYTQHLLSNIGRPGLRIEDVFKRVRLGVRLDSNGEQIPWENTSLEGDFSFLPSASNALSMLPAPPAIEKIALAEASYNLLRDGKFDLAEKNFKELASSNHQDVMWMGKEGLAEIHLQRHEPEPAIHIADEIISKAPQRSAAYLIRGRALSLQGKTQQSAESIKTSINDRATSDFAWQKSNAYLAAANLERKKNVASAAKQYEKAVKENPSSVEALKGLALSMESLGRPEQMMAVLEKAQRVAPLDATVKALLNVAKDSLRQQQDAAKQKYIDDTVKELAAQFHQMQAAEKKAFVDDWTSMVMAVSVLPFQDNSSDVQGGDILGLDRALQQELIRQLQSKGIEVVERAMLDKLMAELKLGSSALADPDTQLKLGRLFAARLLVTGNVGNMSGREVLAGMRTIDTETSRLMLTRADKVSNKPDPVALATNMANAIAEMIVDKYPLKGRIALVEEGSVIINLGKKHGVQTGQVFNVLGEGEPIELNGRVIGRKQSKLAQLTVTNVDDLMAYASVAEQKGSLEKNQKVILKGK